MKRLLYLSTRGVAGAGPCGGGLDRTMRALRRQPAAAVRVAEALAVLFADLHEHNGRVFTRLRTRGCFFFFFFSNLLLCKLFMPVQRLSDRKDSP